MSMIWSDILSPKMTAGAYSPNANALQIWAQPAIHWEVIAPRLIRSKRPRMIQVLTLRELQRARRYTMKQIEQGKQ